MVAKNTKEAQLYCFNTFLVIYPERLLLGPKNYFDESPHDSGGMYIAIRIPQN